MSSSSGRVIALALLLAGCAPAAPEPAAPEDRERCAPLAELVQLVESAPAGTGLEGSPLFRTHEVWAAMIDGATRTLDIEQFYLANAPDGRLEPVLQAIERAAARGVKVRLIADATFAETYPESLARLQGAAEVRRLDATASMGGVQHAKHFVVDGCDFYLGSANFDWRSLEHIHELGVRMKSASLAGALGEVFALDWALAQGGPRPAPSGGASAVVLDTLRVRPAFSPKGFLPDESSWDLPQLVAALDGARETVSVELLSYEPAHRDGRPFLELDRALRRAAARGVSVRLLLSHWNTRAAQIEPLKALAQEPRIEVRIATIPEHASGFIPFARVIHAKYLVVDQRLAWIGTSNWSGDYFFASRNVGLVLEGPAFARDLHAVFERLWNGPYAEPLDPERSYPEPRIEK